MSTIYVNHSLDGQIKVTGDDRHRFLQGMCMSDVAAMKPGDWLRTAMLSHKGRILVVFEVLAFEDELRLVCEPGFGDKLFQALDDHIIADDVELESINESLYRMVDSLESFWTAPCVFGEPPVPAVERADVETMRIEAGFPRDGIDIGEKDFPFESGLARYIDYKKGCYVGQEPVARVFYKGAPQRVFRGIHFEDGLLAEVGQSAAHPERKNAGTISSSCVSATYGSIALAYLHRSVAEPGTELDVAGQKAIVRELPFG